MTRAYVALMVAGTAAGAVLLPSPAAAAEPPSAPPSALPDDERKTRADLDLGIVSIAGAYSIRLGSSSFWVGANHGIGPSWPRFRLGDDKKLSFDPLLEAWYWGLFTRFAPSRHLELDVGGRVVIARRLFEITDAPRGAFVVGPYADLRFGSPTVKVGPRVQWIYQSFSRGESETAWVFTPIMVRVSF